MNFKRLFIFGLIWLTGESINLSYGEASAPAIKTPPLPQIINWMQLPLTAAQKEAIVRHDTVWQRAFEQLYPDIIQEREHLRRLLFDRNTDTEAIFESLKHLEDTEQELRYEAVKNFLLKKQELTDEQRTQIHQFLSPLKATDSEPSLRSTTH